MKQIRISSIALAFLLLVYPMTFTAFVVAPVILAGCSTTDTREAVTYHSLKDTWNVAHAAYGVFCERVVQGKVTKEQEAQADAAWNLFRSTFRTALVAAGQNWSAAPPPEVNAMADKVVVTLKSN
jgi:hypothetical protein